MGPVEPKRRRLRISLRVLMLLVLVTGVWMGCLVSKARRQREAIAAIKKFHGLILYDHEIDNGRWTPNRKAWAPDWLRRLVGDDYLLNVSYAGFMDYSRPDSSEDDEALSLLKHLTGLKSVVLKGTQTTEKGMNRLSELTGVESLTFDDARMLDDVAARGLKGMKSLKLLFIQNSQISDSGWKFLSGLDNLNILLIPGNELTDSGITYLKGLKNLHQLDISRSKVTDRGLEQLKGLNNLRVIQLGGTRITEEGKASFKAAMPNLKVIR